MRCFNCGRSTDIPIPDLKAIKDARAALARALREQHCKES